MPRFKAHAGAVQEQQPALDDLEFWVYLQPVGLYNVLASRPVSREGPRERPGERPGERPRERP